MKVAVFRALQISDLLCTIPAFRALRLAYPKAEITLIGLPWAQFLVERYTYIDRLIPFPGFPGLSTQSFTPKKVVAFIRKMQTEYFDLLLQMHGHDPISNSLIQLLHAKQVTGFYSRDSYYPPFTPAVEYPDYGSEIHRLLTLLEEMGIPLQGDYLEFPLLPTDAKEIRNLSSPKAPYVCIHPGTRRKKRWPYHFFAKAADYCVKKGYDVVITGKTEEFAFCEQTRKHMRFPAINLAGKTSLGGIGMLIQKSNALISSSTALTHIASALKIPSLTLCFQADSERWAPLNTIRHRIIDWQTTPSLQIVLSEVAHILNSQQILYYESAPYAPLRYRSFSRR